MDLLVKCVYLQFRIRFEAPTSSVDTLCDGVGSVCPLIVIMVSILNKKWSGSVSSELNCGSPRHSANQHKRNSARVSHHRNETYSGNVEVLNNASAACALSMNEERARKINECKRLYNLSTLLWWWQDGQSRNRKMFLRSDYICTGRSLTLPWERAQPHVVQYKQYKQNKQLKCSHA